MRPWLKLSLALGFLSLGAMAGEVTTVSVQELPGEADDADKKFVKDLLEKKKGLLQERSASYDALGKKITELNKLREDTSKLLSGDVTIDGETKSVTEPVSMEEALGMENGRRVRDPYEISPDDFVINVHDRWAVNVSDFRIDAPQYITSNVAAGKMKTWFGFSFSVTNTTAKKRRISPMFTAVTNKGVFNHAVGGFVPERMMADSLMRPLGDSVELRDKELLDQRVAPLESIVRLAGSSLDPEKGTAQLSPMSTFEAGQTRSGAALWTNFSDEFTELKIIVYGLTNAHRYDEKMRRALVLTFERNDDEFDTHRTELKYKDKRWEYLWMWDQDITVPIPADPKVPQLKVETLQTPAGASKLAFAFPFVIKNSTRFKQEIAVHSVSMALPVEVEVGGMKIPVEAHIVDDGRSTIYKAQMLKGMGKEATKDRYDAKGVAEGSKTALERRLTSLDVAGALEENVAVFDEADVDWNSVRLQVESALTEKLDKKAAATQKWDEVAKAVAPDNKDLAQKNPGMLYDPRRHLTDEEFAVVKEQVSKGLPTALDAAKAKKTVVAYFNCTSGLSTGSFRISRCYRQPGVVDEGWLKAWEDLDKAE